MNYGPTKLAFVVHATTAKQLKRLPQWQKLERSVFGSLVKRIPDSVVAFLAQYKDPIVLGKLEVGSRGSHCVARIYGLPITTGQMQSAEPEWSYKQILDVARDAYAWGAELLALGAHTSVVGDKGQSIARRSPIPVTSGNSYTVAAAIQAARQLLGSLSCKSACVVGATGSIGRAVSKMLAEEVKDLYLNARDRKRLAEFRSELKSYPCHTIISEQQSFCTKHSHLIISATSSPEPVIDLSQVREGAVVIDLAEPPDVDPEQVGDYPEVIVVPGGHIRLPADSHLSFQFPGLLGDEIHACFAEGVILSLASKFECYSLGSEIEISKVKEIAGLGEHYGFRVST